METNRKTTVMFATFVGAAKVVEEVVAGARTVAFA